MKIAAVLIPIAIFILPTFTRLGYAVKIGLQGQGTPTGNGQPLAQAQKRKYYAIFAAYFLTLHASIGWAVFVFTANIVVAICIAVLPPVFIAATLLVVRSILPTIHNPPSEEYVGPKERLEAENKFADQQMAMLKSRKYWLAIILFSLALVLVIAVLTIVFMEG